MEITRPSGIKEIYKKTYNFLLDYSQLDIRVSVSIRENYCHIGCLSVNTEDFLLSQFLMITFLILFKI